MSARVALPWALLAAVAAGCLLSAYTIVFDAARPMTAFHAGLFAWTCLPYAVSLLLPRLGVTTAHAAAGYALAALGGDLFMHYEVFIAPRGSTAALGLLFMPLWNLLLLGPAGAFLVWLVRRWRGVDRAAR